MAIPSREEMQRAFSLRHGEILAGKFGKASVAVCGLGGLGSNIAVCLARAGIGRLHLIDFDRVDISNLHRQQYFADQLGMDKTEAMKENLARIAPYCRVETDAVRLTAENIPVLLAGEEIICEAFDRPEEKSMLVDAVAESFPEKYLVCGSGMAELASANLIRTRKLGSRFYLCGDGTNGVRRGGGLFATRVMACAAHQAHMVLRLIAGETEP
ncbi:MAG: sulfur carrier protein ThiS adenylyltransferase ThiF [Clostridiales bacterium]|nr:sulfur carrier protein ThiS adenylyltransferase ThiF [Clostridiales bacterium]